MKKYNVGILGCGDFLRWQENDLKNSENIEVKALFDPEQVRAGKFAEKFGCTVVDSEDDVFDDPDIDIVCLFVPPWLRKGMVKKAVDNNKHIITTKPLAPNAKEAEEIVDIVGDRSFGVIYCRTGNAVVETLKSIFESGEIGKMAFYKQDWIHHYPEWNNWALDPDKNGGPFMDAMIHNLNIARYLSAGEFKSAMFFSDNFAHPELKCSDTDFMKVDFDDNSAAYLFITWAADLAVYSTDGNNREHVDIKYMVTDKGWRVTQDNREGESVIVASKDGKEKLYHIKGFSQTVYDRYADGLTNGTGIPADMGSVKEAEQDIKIIFDASC